MLPNLIFLFNLLDVIPLDVQLYRGGGGTRDIARFATPLKRITAERRRHEVCYFLPFQSACCLLIGC